MSRAWHLPAILTELLKEALDADSRDNRLMQRPVSAYCRLLCWQDWCHRACNVTGCGSPISRKCRSGIDKIQKSANSLSDPTLPKFPRCRDHNHNGSALTNHAHQVPHNYLNHHNCPRHWIAKVAIQIYPLKFSPITR